MAKDGTNRGGYQIGGGRRAKPLSEKLGNGNPGGRPLNVLDEESFEEASSLAAEDLEAFDMPPVHEFLKAHQKNGIELSAEEVYRDTYRWLHGLRCDRLVRPHLVEEFAMARARWEQCENAISQYGLIAKHPTVPSGVIPSPYLSASLNFQKQMNMAWTQIFQIVKENCSTDYFGDADLNDPMERLLRGLPLKE